MADVNIDLELITKRFDQSLNRSLRTVQSFANRTDRNFDKINNSVNELNSSAKTLGSSFSKSFSLASSAFGSLVGNIGANVLSSAFSTLTQSIVGFGSSAIENARNLETLQTRFTTLTGSAGAANQVLDELQQFSATTPFQLEGLASTSAQLLSFGFSTEELIPRLQSIGDVAAATGSSVQDIGLIFGQISAAGRLTGERLLQLQERGIPVLDALATQFGTTQAAVQELVTQGKVDFETFQEAFDSLSAEGGIAFEGIIKQSQTLDGVLSTLSDNFSLFSANIGQAALPAIKVFATEFIKLIQSIDAKQLQSFVENGILLVIDGLGSLITNINPVVSAFKFLGNSGILVFNTLKSGVNAIQLALTNLVLRYSQVLNGVISSLPDSIVPEGWKTDIQEFENVSQDAFDGLVDNAIDLSDEMSKNLTSIGDSFDNTISQETVNSIKNRIDELKNKVIEGNKEIEQEVVKSNQKTTRDIQKENDNKVQNEINYQQQIRDLRQAEKDRQEQEKLVLIDEQNQIDQAEFDRFVAFERSKIDAKFAAEEEKAKLIQDSNDRQGKLAVIAAQKEIELEQSKNKKLDELNKIKRQQDLRDQASFFRTATSLSQSRNKELASIGKAAAIAQIAIDTPSAVGSSFRYGANLGGPPLGFAFASIAAIAMADQASRILSAGSFQDGGLISGPTTVGDRLVANVNSGEMILNRNQQAELFNQANGGGTSRNSEDMGAIVSAIENINITLVANDNEIARSTSRGVSNGIVIGESE